MPDSFPMRLLEKKDGMTKQTSILFCDRAKPVVSRIRDTMLPLLESAGYRVTAVDDAEIDLAEYGIVLVHGNAAWFPKVMGRLRRMERSCRPFVTVWHTEPLPPPRASGLKRPLLNHREIAKILLRDARITDVYSNARALRRLTNQGLIDLSFVSTRGRQEYLAEHGISAEFAPYGYDSDWHGRDLRLKRDVDTVFIGALDIPRRRRKLRSLRRRGVHVCGVGEWSQRGCWGEERVRLLNRAKILLNVQRHPGELSGLRCLLGMANGSLVISEPMYRSDPYVPGKHYVSATIEEMPAAIRYYLDHPVERQQIADAGHQLVTREVTLERTVSDMVRAIQNHAASRTNS